MTREQAIARAHRGRPRRVGRRQPGLAASRSSARSTSAVPARPAAAWSSGSATSSATGGWWCTRPTARRCTRRGRWRSTPGCASATASTPRRWPPTTASCCASPRPTRTRRAPSWSPSSPTSSSRSSPPRWAARRCSPPASASARRARCCCPAATPAAARRCGSSASARRSCSRSRRATRPSRSSWRRSARCLQDVYDLPSLVALHRRIADRRLRLVDVQHPAALAVRAVAAVRLRRRVHVRGRLPHRRAPRRRAHPRPGPARRAARPRRAARAARPRGARRGRVRAAAAGRGPPGRATARASPTCCGCSARSPPRRSGARCSAPDQVADWLSLLVDARRVVPVLMSGQERWAVVEDVARLRDGLGVPGAARRARRVHRAGRGPARRPRRPLRPHPRAVPRRRGGRTGSASASRCATRPWPGSAAQGRVLEGEFRPAGRGRRVVRRRGAAARCAAARWPGCATRSSRSSRSRWPGSCRRGSTSSSTGSTRGALRGIDGVVTVVEQLAGCAVPASALESLVLPCAGRRLPARDARRAHRDRRGALGRPRRAARLRRLGLAAPRRHRAADPARPRRARARSADHEAVLEALAGGGAYFFRQLATARRLQRRQGALGRAVGPRLGRPRRQRHPRPAARADPRRPQRPPGAARPGPRPRGPAAAAPARRLRAGAARRGRALVPAPRARDRPHQARPRRRREPARAPRRGHPRRRDERAHAGRVRRRLQGALGLRGHRPLPPRLLRRGARRRPVRHAPARSTGCAPTCAPVRPSATVPRSRSPWPWRRPTRPTRSAPRCPGRPQEAGHRPGRKAGAHRGARRRRAGALRRARRQDPAHLHRRRGRCSPTASRRSAASYAKGRWAASSSRRPTARASWAPDSEVLRRAMESAGFIATPRGLRLRAEPCLRATPSTAPRRSSTPRLSGQVLTRSDFRIPSLATSDLAGATVTETISRGKHLLTRLDSGITLRTHLKMEGIWLVHPVGSRWRRPAHTARVVLRTATTEAVGFQVILDLVRTDQEDSLVGHLGPDLLGPDWDADVALANLLRRPGDPDRRRPARAAPPGRCRQRVQVRALLPRRRRPDDAGRRGPRPPRDRAQGPPAPRGQQGPAHPDHHRRPAPGLPAAGSTAAAARACAAAPRSARPTSGRPARSGRRTGARPASHLAEPLTPPPRRSSMTAADAAAPVRAWRGGCTARDGHVVGPADRRGRARRRRRHRSALAGQPRRTRSGSGAVRGSCSGSAAG